eukprot:1137660-Pelagomonas_calceolata.AAC.4
MEHGHIFANADEPYAAALCSPNVKFCELSMCLARSGYRPQCFRSAALVGGCSDVAVALLD